MSFNPQPIRDAYPDDPLIDELLNYLAVVSPLLHALDTMHLDMQGWLVRRSTFNVTAEVREVLHGELVIEMIRKEIVR